VHVIYFFRFPDPAGAFARYLPETQRKAARQPRNLALVRKTLTVLEGAQAADAKCVEDPAENWPQHITHDDLACATA